MTDLVCRAPVSRLASFPISTENSRPICFQPPQAPAAPSAPRLDRPQSSLARSLIARNNPGESASFSQELSDFWSFNWWQEASGSERALGLGVATLAAVPTAAALGLAGASSIFGAGCGGEVPRENRSPVLNPIGDREMRVGETIEIALSASDPDGDNLSYSLDSSSVGALQNNVFRYTAPIDFNGSGYQIRFYVFDSHGGSDDERIFLRILRDNPPPIPDAGVVNPPSRDSGTMPPLPPPENRPPVMGPVVNRTVNQYSNLSFTVTGSDPDGDSLTWGAIGLPSGATFDSGYFNWTPASYGAFRGIQLYLSDGRTRVTRTFDITVNRVLRDQDGDGFREDVDCNDTRADVRPIDDRVVNNNLHICPGTWGQINVRGSGFSIDPYSGSVTVSSILIDNASDVSINNLRVVGGTTSPSLLIRPVINLNNSARIFLDSLNVACPADSSGSSCVAIVLNNSSQNFINRSTFLNGYMALLIDSRSNNNTTSNCTFMGQTRTDGNRHYFDGGRNNIFRNNIYR